MHPVIKGSLKSWTMWFSALVLLASNLQPLWPQIGARLHFSPPDVQLLGSVIGIVIGWLRTQTTESLASKGSSTEILPPPTVEASPVPFVPSQPEPKK